MDTDQPAEQPVTPSVSIFSTDLHGIAAIQATGEDGTEFCVIDSAVLVDNPRARDYAYAVYREAHSRATRRRVAFAT